MTPLGDVTALADSYDLVVIGAGPAGMAAATLAAAKGASTLLVDENPSPGGQIYRGITNTPLREKAVLGADYWRGDAIATAFRDSDVVYLPSATVWQAAPGFELGISAHGRTRLIQARRVIGATGALERPFPIPGWTLPGVMTAGAAQTLLKASGIAMEGRVVLAGSGPLLWLIAAQYLAAGRRIETILDTTPRGNWRNALGGLSGFATSPYLRKGLGLLVKVRRSVKVVSGVTALVAEGDARLDAVRYTSGGRETVLLVDHLLLHQGVVPNVNLASSMGCEILWDDVQAAFCPRVDGFGGTSVEGFAIAGDGAGIAGAEAAAERGRLAALGALAALGRMSDLQRDEAAAPIRAVLNRYDKGRQFLDALYRPAPQFRVAADDAIACRCEEVTGGQVRDAVTRLGVTGPNQLKSFLRCGMGPCQGRLCGLTITETIAEARGISPEAVGYYRLRAPIKPITLAELASLDKADDEVRMVARG